MIAEHEPLSFDIWPTQIYEIDENTTLKAPIDEPCRGFRAYSRDYAPDSSPSSNLFEHVVPHTDLSSDPNIRKSDNAWADYILPDSTYWSYSTPCTEDTSTRIESTIDFDKQEPYHLSSLPISNGFGFTATLSDVRKSPDFASPEATGAANQDVSSSSIEVASHDADISGKPQMILDICFIHQVLIQNVRIGLSKYTKPAPSKLNERRATVEHHETDVCFGMVSIILY